MQKDLLTIGQVSKLKGVSVKSLRYYDRIGLLKPFYTNPETNYRYYHIDQLIVVDIIIVCIELDIPLKLVTERFSQPNQQQLQKELLSLIDYGQSIANSKLQKLNNTIQHIHTLKDKICLNSRDDLYTRKIKGRNIIIEELNSTDQDIALISKLQTNLYEYCQSKNLHTDFNGGLLHRYNGNSHKKYVYIEILEQDFQCHCSMYLTEGYYLCQQIALDCSPSVSHSIQLQRSKRDDLMVIQEMTLNFNSQGEMDTFKYTSELQILESTDK